MTFAKLDAKSFQSWSTCVQCFGNWLQNYDRHPKNPKPISLIVGKFICLDSRNTGSGRDPSRRIDRKRPHNCITSVLTRDDSQSLELLPWTVRKQFGVANRLQLRWFTPFHAMNQKTKQGSKLRVCCSQCTCTWFFGDQIRKLARTQAKIAARKKPCNEKGGSIRLEKK